MKKHITYKIQTKLATIVLASTFLAFVGNIYSQEEKMEQDHSAHMQHMKHMASAGGNLGKGQKIVTHLSSSYNDLHAAAMALKIASICAKNQAEVTLFVDLEGVRIADNRLPNDLAWGKGATIGELYQKFIAAGGKILVCPHCANAAGISAENLREGAKIGDESSIAKAFLEADKVLDYK